MRAKRLRMARQSVLAFAGALCLAAIAPVAQGQAGDDSLSAALACRGIGDDAERLSCFDAALGREVGDRGTAPSEVVPAGELESVVIESNTAAAATEVEPERVTRPERSSQIDIDLRDADEEGAPAADRTITVVEIREGAFGATTFILEGGETWVQTGGPQARFPAVPFDAILQPGLGDSYFLRSPLGGPRARVMQR